MIVALVALAGVVWSARQARTTTLEAAGESRDATIAVAELSRSATLKVADDAIKNAGRSEWFRRFQAITELAFSENPRKAVLGIRMLVEHRLSDLAAAEEKELCELAVIQIAASALEAAGVDDPANEAGTSNATFVIEADQHHQAHDEPNGPQR
jgi:hypothetical protein